MEKYRKSVIMRITLLSAVVLAAVALGVYDVFFASEAAKESYIFGFQVGATTALGMISAVLIVRLRALLRDEQKLRLQYNKENDERYRAIRAKAGMPMLLISSVGMIAAGIVAGYYSKTVFVTLIAAAMCQMLVGVVIKQINLRKM